MTLANEIKKQSPVLCTGILLILVVLTTFSGGCVNMLMSPGTGSPYTGNSLGQDNPENPDKSLMPEVSPSAGGFYPAIAEVTPVKSEIVTEVAPFLTPDPYPILHGTRINETPQYSFLDREPEFEKIYAFGGNATGLLVNVIEGPLYLVYTVNPQNDCLRNPDSCRGSLDKPVQRPYLTITVRDNETGEIIAEDGYGREYSSDIGSYSISISSENSEGETETITQEPGPRRIVIYREGTFHITMEGNYLDIDLSIITGASPDPLEVTSEKGSGAPSATPTINPEEEEWW